MMNTLMSRIDRTMEAAVVAIFVVILFAGVVQIANRYFIGTSLSWTEELQKYGHIWMVFFAIPVAYNRGAHIGVDILLERMPPGVQQMMKVLIRIGWLVLAVSIIYLTTLLVEVAQRQTSPGLNISFAYLYYGQMIGCTYLAVCVLRQFISGVERA